MNNQKQINNTRGSFLVGVLVALGIMLVMSLIAFPYLKRYQPNLKLSGVVRDLSGNLRYAQQLTITEQVIYGVEIDAINDEYHILKFDAATSTVKTVVLPGEVEFSSVLGFSNNTIRFNSYGAVSESGEIKLTNSNNLIKLINVKPSGFIEIVD